MFKEYIRYGRKVLNEEPPMYIGIPSTGLGVMFDLVADMPNIAAYSFYGIFIILLIIVSPYLIFKKVLHENEEFKKRLTPRLRFLPPHIDFAEIRNTQLPSHDPNYSIYSKFLHVRVENISGAQIEKCRASLVSATRTDSTGVTVTAPFTMPIDLVTSRYHDQFVTIYPGVPQHFDLLYSRIRPVPNILSFTPGITVPYLMEGFFNMPGESILEVAMTGNNVPSITQKIKLNWTGDWDNLNVQEID